MTENRRRPPAAHRALVAAMAFQGVSGVAGGWGLVSDPSGGKLGIPVTWLEGSPFRDYLVPGMVLLTVLGILPLVVAFGLWTVRPWAWAASLLVGAALLVWIGIQIAVIGYQPVPPLQAIYGGLGAVMIVLALLPPVRRYHRRP